MDSILNETLLTNIKKLEKLLNKLGKEIRKFKKLENELGMLKFLKNPQELKKEFKKRQNHC